MARIDAHQQFWNLSEVEYPWLTSEYGPIYRNFDPGDLVPQLHAAGIEKTVLVQAVNSYEENASMLRLADHYDWIGAVVGWVDLMIPEETEARLKMYSKHPKFRGVRHLIGLETNADWIVQPVVLESLKVVSEYHMVFELPGVFPDHLKHVPALAKAAPDLMIVIDHLSKPPIKLHSMSPWEEQLQAAAASPNVYAKISGLNTAADWETWSSGDIKPYIDAAINTLGAKRVMYGSDWPVCNLAGGFQAVWEETQRALDGRSKAEIDAVLGKTAADVYRV